MIIFLASVMFLPINNSIILSSFDFYSSSYFRTLRIKLLKVLIEILVEGSPHGLKTKLFLVITLVYTLLAQWSQRWLLNFYYYLWVVFALHSYSLDFNSSEFCYEGSTEFKFCYFYLCFLVYLFNHITKNKTLFIRVI